VLDFDAEQYRPPTLCRIFLLVASDENNAKRGALGERRRENVREDMPC
jgi:hypothetical protein